MMREQSQDVNNKEEKHERSRTKEQRYVTKVEEAADKVETKKRRKKSERRYCNQNQVTIAVTRKET